MLFFGLLLLFAAIPLEAQTSGTWFNLNPKSDAVSTAFENLVFDHLGLTNSFQLQSQKVQIESLKNQLASFGKESKKPAIFIQCSLDDYEKLLTDSQAKSLLTELQIELLNARIISLPFYILGSADNGPALQLKTSKLNVLQIAFITLPTRRLYEVEEADLLTMLSEILGRPKNTIKIYREREAYPAAKRLHDGSYHLVGIYEDEPPTLLNEFEINLTEELRANPALPLPLDASKVKYQINEVAPKRLKYVFFKYGGEPPFRDLPITAVVQPAEHKFPIILSNLRHTQKDAESAVAKALSYAYFLILPEIPELKNGTESERQNIQRMYLLNAYLSDPDNRFKSLGFLAYLLLLKDKSWKDQREKEIYEDKCEMFMKKVKLDKVTAKSVFDWLGTKVPQLDKRELFTDDISRLYQNALQSIEDGLKATGEKRISRLENARRNLIAALLHADQPKNIKGSRGLWSTTDYNPYYHLARVTFYLEMEKRN